MKLRPRDKAFILVAVLGVALYASLLGARLIEYSHGSFSGLQSALHEAVREGDAAVIRLLLITGADPNLIEQSTGMTPLDRAAESGNLKIARILLGAGAEPNGSGELFGRQPIHVVLFERPLFHAACKRDREMVDLLVEHGASYRVVDAVLLGDTEFVDQAMIENPTVLQEVRYYERSFLYMTMMWGRLDTARFLLELGLDPAEEGSADRDVSVLEYAKRRPSLQDFAELFVSYQSTSGPESEIVETP